MPDIALQHIDLLHSFSYIGIFVAVVLAGHFVPIPEDVSLISAGYIAALGFAKLFPMLAIGIVAPIIGDGILFFLARGGSRFVPSIEKYAPGVSVAFIKNQLENHTFRSVFWMRFITGFRFMSPVLSGYIGIKPKKYIVANTFSAIFYGPFFILLGFFLASKITKVLSTLSFVEHVLILAIGLVILSAIGILLKKKFTRRPPAGQV